MLAFDKGLNRFEFSQNANSKGFGKENRKEKGDRPLADLPSPAPLHTAAGLSPNGPHATD